MAGASNAGKASSVKASDTSTSALSNMIGDIVGDALKGGPSQAAPAAPATPAAPTEPPAPVEVPVTSAEPSAPAAPVEPQAQADDIIPSDVLTAPATPAGQDAGEPADIEPPASVTKDPKANHAWQQVKAERRQLRDEVKALKAEIERVKTSPTEDVQEVLTLKKQVEDYEAKLGQYDLASTKAFQQRYELPAQQLFNRGVSMLVKSGRDPEAAKALMAKIANPSAKMQDIQETVADEPFALQGALMNVASEIQDIETQKGEALNHWKETRAALGAQEARANEVRLAENIEKTTALAVEAAVKEGNWMFAQSGKNQEWNAQVQQRIDIVKGILRVGKPEEIIKFVVEGVTAPVLRKMAMDFKQQADSRKAELDKLIQVTPRLGGEGSSTREAPKAPDKPRSATEFLAGMNLSPKGVMGR
jgi:hypothetical protein